jgi:uncharacterized protein (TIGR00290 family)
MAEAKKAIFNWSGGKDSSLALYEVLKSGEYQVEHLLTTVNQFHNRVSMHGVRTELMEQQAISIGLPLYQVRLSEMPSMEEYNNKMAEAWRNFNNEGIRYSIFGDIFLEDLKKYREEQLAKVGLQAVFPIWKRPTNELLREFIDLGFKAVLVCVNEKYLDRSFAGRLIDVSFIKDLPDNVDPCGENGEYHSFVFDGPIFKTPVDIVKGEIVYKKYEPAKGDNAQYDTGFFYCDLFPEINAAGMEKAAPGL